MTFQVLALARKKMAVFWVVALCSLVYVYRRFKGSFCLHYQGLITLMMKAASTSETSINFYQTIQQNNPEDSHLLTKTNFIQHIQFNPLMPNLIKIHLLVMKIKDADVRIKATCN
jgi:hypothetical protein